MNDKKLAFVQAFEKQMRKYVCCILIANKTEHNGRIERAEVLYMAFDVPYVEGTNKDPTVYIGGELFDHPTVSYESYVVTIVYDWVKRRKARLRFFNDKEMGHMYFETHRRTLNEWCS